MMKCTLRKFKSKKTAMAASRGFEMHSGTLMAEPFYCRSCKAWHMRTLKQLKRVIPALHFIGFKGDEYHSAIRVWGQPDFIHRHYDPRSRGDIVKGDTIVFANGEENKIRYPYSFNDSDHF